LGNTRELDGVLVIKYLLYIYLANGLYYTNLAYSKEIYKMTLLLQNFFYVICDQCVTACDITLNLNSKSKMKNKRENKIK